MSQQASRSSRFYDGEVARPYEIEGMQQGDVLVIQERDSGKQLAYWVIADMTAIDSNVLNGEMTFRYRQVPEARLILASSPQRDQLLAAADHLKHWRRRERNTIAKVVGAFTLAGFIIIFGGYYGLAHLAIALVDVMPMRRDQRQGDPFRESVLDRQEVCNNPAGQAALEQLGARLLPAGIAGIPLTLDVVQVRDVNAFALPGNHIIVYSGLIAKAETPEMLAGVLAHEMGHLEMRHPTRGLIEQLGLGVAINLVAGNSNIGNLGRLMAAMSYTRDMERQADERAIVLLHNAGVRADGLAAFFQLLKKDEKLHIPALLSDHPGLEERAAATKQDDSGGPAMSDKDWQALKVICRNP